MAKVEVSTADQNPGADDADRLNRSTGAPIPRVRHQGHPLVNFWRSAVGKKWVMALSGIALLGFVLAHMVGNLKLYLGSSHLNEYAEWLRTLGEPALPRTVLLWGMRLGLIAAFVLHIVAAAQLTRMNHQARPVKYQAPRDYVAANFASRHDAVDGRDHRPLPHLPPDGPDVGPGQPGLRARGRVRQRHQELRACPCRDHLHHRQHRTRDPHLPRRVEHVPEPWMEQPTVQPLAPRVRRSRSRWSSGSAT